MLGGVRNRRGASRSRGPCLRLCRKPPRENAAVHSSITKTADRWQCLERELLPYGKAAISSIQVSDKLPTSCSLRAEPSQGTTYDEATGLWTDPHAGRGRAGDAGDQNRRVDATVGNPGQHGRNHQRGGAEPAASTHPRRKLINALNYGFLTVNKTVTGSGPASKRLFPSRCGLYECGGAAVHGIGIYVKGNETHTFDAASPLTFELRHDETVIRACGPEPHRDGDGCKGYTCTWKNEKGVITANQLIQATFVNERQRNTEIPRPAMRIRPWTRTADRRAPSVAA